MINKILFGFVCVFLFGVAYSQSPVTRVVNGSPIEYKSYYAYVEAHGSNVTTGSGTFITRRHVLTSASMVGGYVHWVIGYGSLDFTQLTTVTSYVALMHNNVQTQFWPIRNDIGIILLTNDVNSPIVEPVSLPITSVPLPRDNEEGLVVGLTNTGQNGEPTESSVLQGVYLQTIATNRCISTHIVNPLQNTFCASDPWYSSNSCAGNVGSGFVVQTRGEEILVGIMNSFHPSCGTADVTTYIHIQYFLPWIRAIIGDYE